MISSLNAKNQMKKVVVELMKPKGSANDLRTSHIYDDSFDSILRKITHGVVGDKCQDGVKCEGGTISGALNQILSILATRLGKTGTIGYKSVQKSEIKKEKFKLKLNDDLLKLRGKQEVNGIKNEKDKETKKYNNDNILESDVQNLNTEYFNAADEYDDEMEQDSEEIEPTTNGVEYFVYGGNKIAPLN